LHNNCAKKNRLPTGSRFFFAQCCSTEFSTCLYIPLLDRPTTVNKCHNHTDHRQCKKRNCMGSMRFHRWAKCKRMIDTRNSIINSTGEKDYREDNSSIKKPLITYKYFLFKRYLLFIIKGTVIIADTYRLLNTLPTR